MASYIKLCLRRFLGSEGGPAEALTLLMFASATLVLADRL